MSARSHLWRRAHLALLLADGPTLTAMATPRMVDVRQQIRDDYAAAIIRLRLAQFRRRQRDDAANRRAVADAYERIDAILDMANDMRDEPCA